MNIIEKINSFNTPFINRSYGENVMLFPIAKGEQISANDYIVVHKKRGTACKPKKYMGKGFAFVGQAVLTFKKDETEYVICRDGIFALDNACDDHRISDTAKGKLCYFSSDCEVSDDCRDTSIAGVVCGTAIIEKNNAIYDIVFVRTNARKVLDYMEEVVK